LISALNSEDAGTLNVANGLFELPGDIVQAAFGNNPALKALAEIARDIPAFGTGASEGSAECLARCRAQQQQHESLSCVDSRAWSHRRDALLTKPAETKMWSSHLK
jgi:hypothetical protein